MILPVIVLLTEEVSNGRKVLTQVLQAVVVPATQGTQFWCTTQHIPLDLSQCKLLELPLSVRVNDRHTRYEHCEQTGGRRCQLTRHYLLGSAAAVQPSLRLIASTIFARLVPSSIVIASSACSSADLNNESASDSIASSGLAFLPPALQRAPLPVLCKHVQTYNLLRQDSLSCCYMHKGNDSRVSYTNPYSHGRC